jgi:uncharacterized membrane protein
MLERVVLILIFVASMGGGIVGGIFYAFSSFVMSALGRIPHAHGIEAMNSINVTVINPIFMLVFMGTALLSLVLGGASLFWWDHTSAKLILLASLLYFVGCFGTTMLFNVPLNNQLAAVEPAQSSALWMHYQQVWTAWNHVRTAAAIASSALFTLALIQI